MEYMLPVQENDCIIKDFGIIREINSLLLKVSQAGLMIPFWYPLGVPANTEGAVFIITHCIWMIAIHS